MARITGIDDEHVVKNYACDIIMIKALLKDQGFNPGPLNGDPDNEEYANAVKEFHEKYRIKYDSSNSRVTLSKNREFIYYLTSNASDLLKKLKPMKNLGNAMICETNKWLLDIASLKNKSTLLPKDYQNRLYDKASKLWGNLALPMYTDNESIYLRDDARIGLRFHLPEFQLLLGRSITDKTNSAILTRLFNRTFSEIDPEFNYMIDKIEDKLITLKGPFWDYIRAFYQEDEHSKLKAELIDKLSSQVNAWKEIRDNLLSIRNEVLSSHKLGKQFDGHMNDLKRNLADAIFDEALVSGAEAGFKKIVSKEASSIAKVPMKLIKVITLPYTALKIVGNIKDLILTYGDYDRALYQDQQLIKVTMQNIEGIKRQIEKTAKEIRNIHETLEKKNLSGLHYQLYNHYSKQIMDLF